MESARDENQNLGAAKEHGDPPPPITSPLSPLLLQPPAEPPERAPSPAPSSSIEGDSDVEDCYAAEARTRPKLPDGGWGWMVVLASLVISMIADGISFSFGLLYIEFLKEFGESKSKTAWIGSLFMAVPLLSGPVMSALVDRYGCRAMTIVGGLISATGFIVSTRVHSVQLMLITFGVWAGLGLGLCYVTAIVSIAYWFERRRSLAVGLGACGTGIGTFLYAPLTLQLIHMYGWRGTTLVLAGTFLNMCVCGALMRDPEWLQAERARRANATNPRRCPSVSTVSGAAGDAAAATELRDLLRSGQKAEYELTSLDAATEPGEGHCRSVVNIPTFVRQNEKVPLEVLEALASNKRLCSVVLANYPSLLTCRSVSDRGLDKVASSATPDSPPPVVVSMKVKRNLRSRASVPAVASPLAAAARQARRKRQASVPACAHYLRDIRLHKNSVVYRGAMLNIHRYRLRASSCPDIYRNSMTTLAQDAEPRWYDDTLQLVRGMLDFSMFLELHFLLMSVSTILLYTWFIVPYFYLAEMLTRRGYEEEDASMILSVIGVTNTIGMVALGWAGDQPWIHVTKAYACCLVLCGASIFVVIVYTTSYPALIISSASFGLFFSSNYSLTPAILVELVPLERFTTAYGLILLCQGIGNLLGPPLAGWIFDVTGTWDMSFLQASFWIVVAGVMLAAIPYTTNRKLLGSGPVEKEREVTPCSVAKCP